MDCDVHVDGYKGDFLRWIDTSTMLSDCVTKNMSPDRFINMVSTGLFDTTPTEESIAIKAKHRQWRALTKEQEQTRCKHMHTDRFAPIRTLRTCFRTIHTCDTT